MCRFKLFAFFLFALGTQDINCFSKFKPCKGDNAKVGSCARFSAGGRNQIPPVAKAQVMELSRLQAEFEQLANRVRNSTRIRVKFPIEFQDSLIFTQSSKRTEEITPTLFAVDDSQTCPRPNFFCRDSKFRSADGSCNNLRSPRLGMSLECLQRLLEPNYDDNHRVIRRSVTGRQLPSARVVSLQLHPMERATADVTHMIMQWGQFLDHDISQSPVAQSPDGPIQCCNPQNGRHPECLEIFIPGDDPFYSQFGESCMNFVRSATCLSCQSGARQQLSLITSFIDASNVYGSSDEETSALRFRDGSGRLRVALDNNGGELLPQSADTANDQCSIPERNLVCFRAGDNRVNQQAALVALHTIWLRQHNRVALALGSLNRNWDDERIFQETRRIVGAQMQMITYNEFLPLVLGDAAMDKHGLRVGSSSYSPELNPRIFTEFSTAAYRFGHSLISGRFTRIESQGQTQTFNLRDNWFNPFVLYDGDMDSILRGLVGSPAARFDPFFDNDVRQHLYKPTSAPFGLDLVSINVQRGRDHGLQGYTRYLEFCHGDQVTSFEALDKYMPQEQRVKFQNTYARVEDIDLFSAGVSELPVQGGLVGPTFACIIGIQFKHLKYGDRYYFEHTDQTGSFSQAQLAALKNTRLSKVICANGDRFPNIHQFAMKRDSNSDPVTSCESIPDVDLSAWQD